MRDLGRGSPKQGKGFDIALSLKQVVLPFVPDVAKFGPSYGESERDQSNVLPRCLVMFELFGPIHGLRGNPPAPDLGYIEEVFAWRCAAIQSCTF